MRLFALFELVWKAENGPYHLDFHTVPPNVGTCRAAKLYSLFGTIAFFRERERCTKSHRVNMGMGWGEMYSMTKVWRGRIK